MGNGRKPPADPAERALHAARECRDAAREAHETIQALRELLTDVKAEIARAKTFSVEYVQEAVPREIQRQLTELGPKIADAMNASVAQVTQEFTRLEAALLGKDTGGAPGPVFGAYMSGGQLSPEDAVMCPLLCPSCGARNMWHSSLGQRGVRPVPGDVSVCWRCTEVSVFRVTGDGGIELLPPTPEDLVKIGAHLGLQQVITSRRLATFTPRPGTA